MKPVVYILESVDERALSRLPTDRFTIVMPGEEPEDFAAVRAIVVRGKEQVDRALIDRCPHLSVIVRNGVGVNNIDVDYATARGIQVLNVPGANADTVAEHTIGLMLMLVRGMYRLVREVKQGNWNYRDAYAGQELRQLKLGIIGMGDIGQKVGGIAGAMGMKISGASRNQIQRERVLADSDVVSLHVPLTDQTRDMIDAAALSRMKPGAFLINTARGEVVDAQALLEALESGHLGGYGSDLMVAADDDLRQRLLDHPKVLITPHAASLTALTFFELSDRGLRHVADHLGGVEVEAVYRVNEV
ncbi:phosphoglycerate dehydrogenase-like enzyme [Lewinella aquimaris]|uniref:Phosphoglycerate dehydrogenase-like enzyme n=1 Tax=Neolewinella aquimaris TaxID=1835722 RepID=A0A840E987_9BACT|nr:NAD(P)-dependent oxidoreductase [Neolewinella aquimaris]MBB4080503.1 phosphoglycerate dehydrogenase-like enzyme [Neolewinella aquimaris]